MSTTKKRLRYFYYQGDLHKKVHINRGTDVITAWNYPKGKLCKYVYSDVKRNGEKAFSTADVQKLVRRGRRPLEKAIHEGHIPQPQMTYGMDEKRNPYAWYWSEKDIINLHGYLKTVHFGRPRHDGMVTPRNLPSEAELRAMLRQSTILYVQTDEGNFVPTWQAEKF